MCDFSLTNGSPGKQGATHLTVITEPSENSPIIKVQDSLYFYDGFSIEQGDKIIIGSNETVIVTQIIDQNTIRINRPINTSTDDKVYLSNTGTTPDIGIYGCSLE